MKETLLSDVAQRAQEKLDKNATPFERFKELTRRLIAVPKSEISKGEATATRSKRNKKRKGSPRHPP